MMCKVDKKNILLTQFVEKDFFEGYFSETFVFQKDNKDIISLSLKFYKNQYVYSWGLEFDLKKFDEARKFVSELNSSYSTTFSYENNVSWINISSLRFEDVKKILLISKTFIDNMIDEKTILETRSKINELEMMSKVPEIEIESNSRKHEQYIYDSGERFFKINKFGPDLFNLFDLSINFNKMTNFPTVDKISIVYPIYPKKENKEKEGFMIYVQTTDLEIIKKIEKNIVEKDHILCNLVKSGHYRYHPGKFNTAKPLNKCECLKVIKAIDKIAKLDISDIIEEYMSGFSMPNKKQKSLRGPTLFSNEQSQLPEYNEKSSGLCFEPK